jgi:hypothetical protein
MAVPRLDRLDVRAALGARRARRRACIRRASGPDSRRTDMAKLVSISSDTGGHAFIGVDEDGNVWQGRIERDRSDGAEYIRWKRLRSEFYES